MFFTHHFSKHERRRDPVGHRARMRGTRRGLRSPRIEELEGRTLLSAVYGDFNGDGYDDLAIGAPGEDIGTLTDAGAVTVLYGSDDGPMTDGNQFWHQDSAAGGLLVEGRAESGDRFGAALVVGNFNGDAYDDLAIGVPGEDVETTNAGTIVDAGAVNILYGSASGLTVTNNRLWHQGKSLNGHQVDDLAESNDHFGAALAAGDFDGDGDDDLAIGAPDEDVRNLANAGLIHILLGRAGVGLTAEGDQSFAQGNAGDQTMTEAGDRFGAALAAGNFNGDQHRNGNAVDDLAVGAPDEDVDGVANAGAVNVFYGSIFSGLNGAGGAQFWHQNSDPANGPAVADSAEPDDRFGAALAAGDFRGDGYDDLAIGVPGEDVGSLVNAGAVAVLNGTSLGLNSTFNQFWHQDNEGNNEDSAERATASARRWPRATSTATTTARSTASTTWRSAPPARMSVPSATPAPSLSFTAWPAPA
jgi:hypothetical protein